MSVPASTIPTQGRTISSVASVPHGTTINAQGLAPVATKAQTGLEALKKAIPVTDIIPFTISSAGDPVTAAQFAQDKKTHFKTFSDSGQLNFAGKIQDNRLPTPLTDFPGTSVVVIEVSERSC